MKFSYTTKQGRFEANFYSEVPWDKLHSLSDKPAFEMLNGHKRWYFEGKYHRETGPAIVYSYEYYEFFLNGKKYKNINDWLKDHPNKDITFQTQMRLKYT